jgi:serpin B
MRPASENVKSPSKSISRRHPRRTCPTHSTRLFVEELEPRCLLSGGALPLSSFLPLIPLQLTAMPILGQSPLSLPTQLVSPLPSLGQNFLPQPTQPVSPGELAAGQSTNALGEDLYSLLQGQSGGSGNMLFSPASIATALSLVDAGAQGETASQISSVLHAANIDPGTLAQDFGSLLTDLNSAGQGQYALALADALWGQQGFPFNQAFLNQIQADYGAGLQQVDFSGNPEGARQIINAWVAQQTDNKIQDLFPQGSITPDDKLVLTNAVYFNGDWATPFSPGETHNANFTLFSGDQVQTPTMHQTSQFGYMASDGYQVLEMPYVSGRIAMDIILPGADSGSQGLDVSQLPADLNGWLGGLSQQQVQVSLPKFDMTTSFDLTAPLQDLGMTDAFSKQTADFSGISPINPSQNRLHVGDVVQQAYVDVDEGGTEAAAATGIGMLQICCCFPTPPPVVFNADHPFLFVIRDTQSGSILFEGQVADPTSEGADPSAPPIPVSQSLPPTDLGIGPVAPPAGPAIAQPTVQVPNNLNPPVGQPTATVAPPAATVPSPVTIVAQLPGDQSKAQPMVVAPSPPALVYESGSKAGLMPAEASTQAQPDSSSASPSAAPVAQKVPLALAPSQSAVAAAMQDPGLAADSSQVFVDPSGPGTSVENANRRTKKKGQKSFLFAPPGSIG